MGKTMQQIYKKRFVFRIFVFFALLALYGFYPQSFLVLKAGYFWRNFSVLHIFWAVWVWDMILQLFPSKDLFTMGNQKQFKINYLRPLSGYDQAKLKQYRRESNLGALKVLAAWLAAAAIIGALSFKAVLGAKELLLLTAFFYVCDLVCILFWCPFQKWFLKNRCCVTCRIYNWDSLMTFTPLLFAGGFYSFSLFP